VFLAIGTTRYVVVSGLSNHDEKREGLVDLVEIGRVFLLGLIGIVGEEIPVPFRGIAIGVNGNRRGFGWPPPRNGSAGLNSWLVQAYTQFA
jgi:hypothetical protein